MDDDDIVEHINQLATEEHRLERSHPPGEGLTACERARLRDVEVALDQCWDLLRQRRARRSHGGNPDEAAVRPIAIVQAYQQ